MTLSQVRDILGAQVLCGGHRLEREVRSACGSDFMSDVLAFVKDQALLLTGLVNPQVIRTAGVMDMKCIVFVRGKLPGQELLHLADQAGITVMCSPMRMYEACGRLYAAGLRGEE